MSREENILFQGGNRWNLKQACPAHELALGLANMEIRVRKS